MNFFNDRFLASEISISKLNVNNSKIKANDTYDNLNLAFDENVTFLLKEKKEIPTWPVLIQLFCALICLGFSTIFHLFNAYSKKVGNVLNRLDYAGISILIAGSCFPLYFYMFYCSKGIFLNIFTYFNFIFKCF